MDDTRLIDAKALTRTLLEILMQPFFDDPKADADCYFDKDYVFSAISNAPTIDAVPVVRCRECQNHKWWPTPNDTVFCNKWREWVPCNGFCHKGAKMDGGEGST